MDGSLEGEVNSLSITKYFKRIFFFKCFKNILYNIKDLLIIYRSGEYFVSGGEDKEIKIWHYDEGICKYFGFGHSNSINKVILILNLARDLS